MVETDTILFDVDGTLVDARKDIVKAVNYTLRSLGLNEKGFDEIISYVGTGVKDLISKCLGSENGASADKAVKIFSDYYVKHSSEETILYPGVKDTILYFKDKGIKLFILTNRFKNFADMTLREMGIRSYFEEIIAGDDENCMKPSPCVLEDVFSRKKLDREKSLIVGDMSVDIEMGRNAGIRTCFVTYGLGKKEELGALKPDYIIDSISSLKDIVR